MLERIITPTKRLEEKANAYATEGDETSGTCIVQEEADAFIAGANYILDAFEHWATGLWEVNGGPDPSSQFHYGFLVARDIKERCLPMFRSIEIHSVNTKKEEIIVKED